MGGKRGPELSFIGQPDILAKKKLSLFCSVRCPGSLIIKAHDFAHALRHAGLAVISGFQSPVEQECLTILLRGPASVVLCPARSVTGLRIRPEWRVPLDNGRLLLLSAFPESQRRPTVRLAAERNRLVAALADMMLVVHAAQSSKTLELVRQGVLATKTVYTFDDPANAHLLTLGAAPVLVSDHAFFSASFIAPWR